MVKALTELRDELAGAREGAMRHARLVTLGQDLAVIMLSETSDWQIVFATRPLGLPA
jgi:hypothetical protein